MKDFVVTLAVYDGEFGSPYLLYSLRRARSAKTAGRLAKEGQHHGAADYRVLEVVKAVPVSVKDADLIAQHIPDYR